MRRNRKQGILVSLGILGIWGSAGATELLHFDFDDPACLACQAAGLPEGNLIGSVPTSDSGIARFGAGVIRLPGFPGPQGPFTIESRFRARSYGPESSRFNADILNTATWDSEPTGSENVPSQGFMFRLGGGYVYLALPRDRYDSETEWLTAQEIYSHIDRGRMSACFGSFGIARRDDARNWKHALTDRCVERGAWTHMAAVWDGENMRVYLNGMDATDTLRLDGVGKPERIDSLETAYVGARTNGGWDPRNFDGDIDFVRMVDRALTPDEIKNRYKDTFVPEKRDSLCHGVIVPVFPEAGRACKKGKLDFTVRVANHGACTDPAFIARFLAGDSVEIELSANSDFNPAAVRLRFAKLDFSIDEADLGSLAGFQGAIYWRVRLIPAAAGGNPLAKASGSARAAAGPGEWSPSRPMVVDLAANSALSGDSRDRLPARPRLVALAPGMVLTGAAEPALYNLSGRRIPARFRRIAEGSGGIGLWRLESSPPAVSGVLLAR